VWRSSALLRITLLLLVALLSSAGLQAAFTQSAAAVSKSFVVPGTDWNTASNWSPVGVPTSSDDVVSLGGFAVVISSGAQAVSSLSISNDASSSLTISGGSLSIGNTSHIDRPLTLTGGATIGGSGPLTMNALFTYSDGALDTGGTATANGGIAMGTGGQKTLRRTLINPAGQTASLTDGPLCLDGGTFTNNGAFEVRHAGGGSIFCNGAFTNSSTGTFTKFAPRPAPLARRSSRRRRSATTAP